MGGRTNRILASAAAACWLASWFLPVVDDNTGWQAFMTVLSHQGGRSGEDAVPQIMSALTNFVFIAMWVTLWRSRVEKPPLFIKIALACFIINLYWLVQAARAGEAGGLLLGYYAWLLGFALLIVSGVSIHRTSRTPTAGTPA
jgi:hypothetical protein